jgi:hypothetical protein
MPGRGDVATAREFERRIRNLLAYKSAETREMAKKLLAEASRNRKVSARQLKHLETLFEIKKPWKWRRTRNASVSRPVTDDSRCLAEEGDTQADG